MFPTPYGDYSLSDYYDVPCDVREGGEGFRPLTGITASLTRRKRYGHGRGHGARFRPLTGITASLTGTSRLPISSTVTRFRPLTGITASLTLHLTRRYKGSKKFPTPYGDYSLSDQRYLPPDATRQESFRPLTGITASLTPGTCLRCASS